MKVTTKRLKDVIRELLINSHCSCGGWTCSRCMVTVDEAKKIVPNLRDNIDKESDIVDTPLLFAAGYKVSDDEYGMFAGPTPDLQQILQEIPDNDMEHVPYILMLEDDKIIEIYFYDFVTGEWISIDGK